MTIQSMSGYMLWPSQVGSIRRDWGGSGATTIDASGEKAAIVFKAPVTGTIDRVGFRTRTVTTAQTLRAGLETVSGGNPTGTQYGGSAVGTQASPISDTFYEVTLGTSASATVNNDVALVVQFDSTVGDLQIAHHDREGGTTSGGIPYVVGFAAAAWTKNGSVPLCTIRYSDGTYYAIGTMPTRTVTDTYFASNSASDEIGNRFQLPYPVRVAGLVLPGGATSATADFEGVLYDSDGTTVLGSAAFDADSRADDPGHYYARFSSTVDLDANTTYRAVMKPTTTNTWVRMQWLSVLSSGMLGSLPSGTSCYRTYRVDAGSWTDVTDEVANGPFLQIIGADDAAGGGGGVTKIAGKGGGIVG